jgi:hypothetical protein
MTFADDLLDRLHEAAWVIVIFTVIAALFGIMGIFAPTFTIWSTFFFTWGTAFGFGLIVAVIFQVIQIYAWYVAYKDFVGALGRRRYS